MQKKNLKKNNPCGKKVYEKKMDLDPYVLAAIVISIIAFILSLVAIGLSAK